jgi:hypothetical protein
VTTSNPNVPPPAGAADPDGEDNNNTVDPLLQKTVDGAVPDEQLGRQTDDGAEPGDVETDSVEDDKRSSGAD